MKDILVSIGVPTIGDNPFVWDALESALSNLDDRCELIISDNASPIGDALAAFAARQTAAVTLIRQPTRLSMAENWNQCLVRARGEFFVLLSDDDVLMAGMVATLAQALHASATAAFAYCRFQWIDETGRTFWTSPSAPRLESSRAAIAGVFNRKRVVLPSATMFRRADLVDVGGYGAGHGNWADMAAWIAVGARHPHVLCDDSIRARYRERKTSLTKLADDTAWARGIDHTLALLKTLYPSDAALHVAGVDYKAYMLADIRLKRLLAGDLSIAQLVWRTWAAGAALRFRQRAWLALKSVYLRIFAKLSASR